MGVRRILLTPRWLALHALVVLVVAGFVALGWWQLGVYRDSQDRHELREREPVPVADLVAPGRALGVGADRQVEAEGRYLADEQLLVPGRAHGDVLGSYVLTPLETSDGTVVPVVRGWIDDADDPAAAAPSGPVSVVGLLLEPEPPGAATGRTDQALDADQIGYLAPEPIAERTGLPPDVTIEGYLLLSSQTPATDPAPVVLDVDAVAPIRDVNPWQNLSYWAQWWVFAAAAIVFWGSMMRSAVRRERADVIEPAVTHAPS